MQRGRPHDEQCQQTIHPRPQKRRPFLRGYPVVLDRGLEAFDSFLSLGIAALAEEIKKEPAESLLRIPGAYEAFSEHFNDSVLDAWESEQN